MVWKAVWERQRKEGKGRLVVSRNTLGADNERKLNMQEKEKNGAVATE